jgi:hypothetical protein
MKNIAISLLSYFTCICFFNFQFADDFSEFGIKSREVEESFLTSLQNPRFYVPYMNSTVKAKCQSIAPQNQAAAVRRIGGLLKSYYASDDFKTRYSEWVNRKFPPAQVLPETRKTQILNDRMRETADLKAQDIEPIVEMQIQSAELYAGMASSVNSMPPAQRAEFKKQVEAGQKNAAFFKKLKPLLKSDLPEARKQYATYLAQDQIAQEEATLAKNNNANALELEKWKDPKKVLSAKLADFLDKTKDVDYSAETKVMYNRNRFVNAAYESKHPAWKFCYRMGKAPSDAARAFAQQWLQELK